MFMVSEENRKKEAFIKEHCVSEEHQFDFKCASVNIYFRTKMQLPPAYTKIQYEEISLDSIKIDQGMVAISVAVPVPIVIEEKASVFEYKSKKFGKILLDRNFYENKTNNRTITHNTSPQSKKDILKKIRNQIFERQMRNSVQQRETVWRPW
ncbi:hypothetical protein ACFFRR_002466 [Megaselia abdita]